MGWFDDELITVLEEAIQVHHFAHFTLQFAIAFCN
ncbi:hypothetical protein BVRB_9g225300 [Beta vulgaris subsp. vulgaris]|uniref:Uncharacterized protein n=1 Tax=Beta vulgaris subsp. vulgaris TaxID=3555 RepID=A0A0J8DZZ5_BETVV|nr:hypothetical protein BVRB_9g225300 [Beta vulgaris subsp. vulgaris]